MYAVRLPCPLPCMFALVLVLLVVVVVIDGAVHGVCSLDNKGISHLQFIVTLMDISRFIVERDVLCLWRYKLPRLMS